MQATGQTDYRVLRRFPESSLFFPSDSMRIEGLLNAKCPSTQSLTPSLLTRFRHRSFLRLCSIFSAQTLRDRRSRTLVALVSRQSERMNDGPALGLGSASSETTTTRTSTTIESHTGPKERETAPTDTRAASCRSSMRWEWRMRRLVPTVSSPQVLTSIIVSCLMK